MIFLPLYIALLWSLALTPGVRQLARRHGLYHASTDAHGMERSVRPLGGGVVVLLATVCAVLTVLWINSSFGAPATSLMRGLIPLTLASVVIVLVGLLDDRLSLRARQKMAGQLIAVGIMIVAGTRVERLSVFDWNIELGLLTLPFTAFWLLGAINALNLLDGANGSATCIGIIIAATLAGMALILGDAESTVVALALAGALLGFLAYSFPPPTIVLGSAGSMFIGLVVGVLTIQGHMKGPAAIVLATPVALLTVPIVNSSAAVLRHFLAGNNLFTDDRHHLQGVLQRQGFGPRGVLLVVSLLCGVTAAGALLSVIFKNQLCAVVSIAAVLGILWVNDLFGYTEAALVSSRLRALAGSLVPDAFRRQAAAPRHTRIGRSDSRVCRHMWTELRQFADRHQLSKVRLDLEPAFGGGHGILWERRRNDDAIHNWQTRIPLTTQGESVAHLEFAASLGVDQARELLAPLGQLIDSLDPHLQKLIVERRTAEAEESAAADGEQASARCPRRLTFDRADITGVKFDFLTLQTVLIALENWRQRGQRGYVTLTNPHSVVLCHRNPAMYDATARADLTLPDGVGTIMAAKILGYGRRHRVAGPPLMLEICDRGREHGYRHFFFGGQEKIAERLAARMRERFPGLEVAGTYCPPFRELTSSEDERIVEMINRTRPDIVWVGLGAPKQEKWMAEHAICINATAMIGVGAAFDFHTGNVKWAPWIVRKTGMEWAYRLACEPRRMWRRNLDSPIFLMQVTGQRMKRLVRQALGKPSLPRIRRVTWDPADWLDGAELIGDRPGIPAGGGEASTTERTAADRSGANQVEIGS